MDSKSLYQQLLDYEPLGFIDPFNDLGTYDALQKSFKEPISDLLNPYSGHPYSKAWQKKIAAMRELYIAYQMSLGDTKKTYTALGVIKYYQERNKSIPIFRQFFWT